MDKNKFKYYVAAQGKSLADIALNLQINPVTLSRKLNGTTEFTRKEIESVKIYLNLSVDEMMDIFFTQ